MPNPALTTLIDHINTVVVGKPDIIKLTVTALLAGGHVLFEDVPGVGKTTLARALARSVAGDFNRIQFTPDLLPNDILGVSILNQTQHEFDFHPGPIFTTMLLADEINRATPRTQSALLQAMAERQVTIDGTTYDLPANFFVLATENPNEYAGTYPLPEAQLDRFLFSLQVGYPTWPDELALYAGDDRQQTLANLQAVLADDTLTQLKASVNQVTVDAAITSYVLTLVQATRQQAAIRLGISPRGGLALMQAGRAYALLSGRDYVIPADIQAVLVPTFSHRLVLANGAQALSAKQQVVRDIQSHTPVPTEGA
ncbi:AAA family ATPase [Lactiplantibacillus mudanjiangensis]|uniref:Methanol dehydrogenase [Lactobacillus casei subsp. casei ATCC 393] n=1 Tax=Lactiplantibacillus mudanjiangensis TaxID=1296538 RepID=A0A660E4E4_9LACO|nr:MoxR family ATPase [Lactiplantibacillus mudanjiangensis]VDG18816.1 methanol dehydrogenase [Lactobacillus casei subsp. casei ATCC 393] [Lactiplantibacillus mudanjiangensis]VDG25095.1 methanol dehydrogenase [Lactobacillus casei subsp. casei ATCC 393] [Lactiplantibacillus mudanjiangensis]VDG29001.1 methanol dehydrogenase [Lactobacillus casei subsp. casei ATCC 393] [Lactiplantibacillus mudanjiangensis]VDG32915.1 methanol dehydrogenase [Lactobacillus casei subsp. casei ATCC 393] [Lactiplantibacil